MACFARADVTLQAMPLASLPRVVLERSGDERVVFPPAPNCLRGARMNAVDRRGGGITRPVDRKVDLEVDPRRALRSGCDGPGDPAVCRSGNVHELGVGDLCTACWKFEFLRRDGEAGE
jgi:hypothetical protein